MFTTPLTGPANINQLADQLQESTDIRAGLPLSYTLRSVENPAIVVGTNISTEYDIVQCNLIGELPPDQYAGLVDLFEDGIGAMASVSGSDVLVFNKAGDKYAWYNGNLPGVFMEGDERKIYDLQDPNGYEFNKESIKNGVINHAIVYGKNGVGKSNLGLAIFDIVGHLTDFGISDALYSNYSNAFNSSDIAQFHYEFLIASNNSTPVIFGIR